MSNKLLDVVNKTRKKEEGHKEEVWYEVKCPSGVYYSPYLDMERKYLFAGLGDKAPSPKEIYELYTDNKENIEKLLYDEKTQLFWYYDNNIAGKPIKLPSGVYEYKGRNLYPLTLRDEAIVDLETTNEIVKTDLKIFIDNEDYYRDLNISYKLGILLYGPPGGGKTHSIRMCLNALDIKDAIVIYFAEFPNKSMIESLNNSLPGRLKIYVFEELTEMIVQRDKIRDVLNFLDGEDSPDKCIIFATTNYPEKLPMNIVDRPSRFDKLYEFGKTTPDDRKKLIKFFTKREPTLEELKATVNLPVAAIKEVCIDSCLNKRDLIKAIEAMQDRKKTCEKIFAKNKEAMGF